MKHHVTLLDNILRRDKEAQWFSERVFVACKGQSGKTNIPSDIVVIHYLNTQLCDSSVAWQLWYSQHGSFS